MSDGLCALKWFWAENIYPHKQFLLQMMRLKFFRGNFISLTFPIIFDIRLLILINILTCFWEKPTRPWTQTLQLPLNKHHTAQHAGGQRITHWSCSRSVPGPKIGIWYLLKQTKEKKRSERQNRHRRSLFLTWDLSWAGSKLHSVWFNPTCTQLECIWREKVYYTSKYLRQT